MRNRIGIFPSRGRRRDLRVSAKSRTRDTANYAVSGPFGRICNTPRLARPGGIGYPIKAERLYDELYKKTKRWTWRGKDTRKVRRLRALERKIGVIATQASAQLERFRARLS